MEKVTRLCDWPATPRSKKKCGNEVGDDQPTQFTWETVEYELDVCEKHRPEVMSAPLQTIIEVATPTTVKTGSVTRKALSGRKGKAFTTAQVREWAIEQGYDVSPTGRLPNALVDEFQDAMES